MSLAATGKTQEELGALALADERVTYLWCELDIILNRATNAIMAAGRRPEKRVAVYAANSVETAIAYVACLAAGVSSVPVNYHLTPEEAAYILDDADVDLLFVGPETAEKGAEAARLAGASTVVGWRLPEREGVLSWEDWLAESSADEPPAHMQPQPHLHYTSGTTGKPKAAETPPNMFPLRETVEALFDALRKEVAAGPGGASLAVGPLYHTGPLRLTRILAGGGALVSMDRFDAEKTLENIERFSVTRTVMVPTHFQRLLALPEAVRLKYDHSSLRLVAHTGAACPRDVKHRMIEWWGPVLFESYGGTESGPTNMINSEEWLKKPGSVGRTLPPFEPVVISDEGKILGANEEGQLYFRDTTGRGIVYYNDAKKTAAAHREPGLFTLGEVGYVDDEGYVFITDRVSDMIVSGGVNIYPAEIEQVLITRPDILDVAVIGAPNADMGEEVMALIVPSNPLSPPDQEELDIFCREKLAGYKAPRAYRFTDDLGRTPLGKLNKRELRQRYWPTGRTIGG
ncbi:AMP-binding protein [Marinicaulis aureus]|uniref:AMP-binding protein n=1 Tax=Hyphococcus aureus TaxID=2666033 RepID=A0ABW1KU01_9PROT